MKKFIIPCLAAAALLSLTACKNVINEKQGAPTHSSTTTTEETIVRSLVSTTTTETHTTP